MSYFEISSTTGGAQHEANLHLYLHQYHSGPNKNQTVPVSPSTNNSFGLMAVMDWTLHEDRDPGSKVIARAQGMHVQCGQDNPSWHLYFNMVFKDPSFGASTLVVRGWEPTPDAYEWAIVGGTGKFKLAQGIVYGRKVINNNVGKISELFIHVFYRTIEKPMML